MARIRPRWTRWLVGTMTCTLLVFGADILFHAFPAGASNQIQKFASSVLFFGAAALCVAKGRTARHERAEWRLFGLAMALWGAASTYYSFFLWNLPEVPVPSLADVGWLAFYVPAYLAVYKLMRKRAGAFVRAAWLDALVGVLGVGGAAALVVFDVVLDNTTGSVAAVVTNLAYPIGDLGLLALLVAAMTVLGWRGSGVLRWMAPALAVFAVTDSFYLVQVADGSYGGGGWVDLGWPVAAFLVGLAAWHTERPSQRAVPRTGTVFAVPTVVGIAALGLLVLDHFNETTLLALGVAAASLVIILARLHLTVGDNVRLLDQSRREATTDALTGLGNRRQLVADLAVHIDRLDPRRPVVLTLFDLDGFKQYNDTFGHLAGDQLLQRLAGSLSDLLEGCGTAYRMGGDEFCTLWEQPAARLAGITAQDAVQALSEEGGAFAIGCSHGSVLLPTETSDPVMALQAADRSMYLHKRKGRGSAAQQSSDVLSRALAERDFQIDSRQGGAELAALTARAMGASPEEEELALQTGRLHDVGKVAIPDRILNKAGPLDDAEWALVKRHTIIGERILSAAPALAPVGRLVRATHEAYDGSGYPDGLAGEAIPLIARIVAVCDAYLAMRTSSASRLALTPAGALEDLRRCAGSQFDPAVVEAFAGVLEARRAPQPVVALTAA